MLSDLSNYSDSVVAPSSPERANSKRSWPGDSSDLLPSKMKAKRRLGPQGTSSSSPSSSARASSPFAFTNTRLAAYDAPSSPLPSSKLSRSPSPRPLPPPRPIFIVAPVLPPVNNREKPAALDAPVPAPDGLRIVLEEGVRLQFGRKARKSYLEETSKSTLAILLPHSAKNASRLHCTVLLRDARVQVRVFGQNGMKIDRKLLYVGGVAEWAVEGGQEIELAFWGWTCRAVVPGEKKVVKEVTARKVRETALIKTPARVIPIIPDSSPMNSLFDGSDGQDSPMAAAPAADHSSVLESSRPPSPAFSALSILSSSPAPQPASDFDIEADEADVAPPTSARADALVASLSLDLPGLIASAIVFHPRSTVGVKEVVEALLREVGGMWDIVPHESRDKDVEEEAIDAWWDAVEAVLRAEPFFGCIANDGLTDAAGFPLPPAYYYLPDNDTSKSRVEALEPFVKRVRGARLEGGGKRYFWRRPCLKKNR